MVIFYDFAFATLLFLPGILLLVILSEKIKLQINALEKVLYGGVLWHYLFVASSIILGLITNFVVVFFAIFNIISVFIIIASLVIILKKQKSNFQIRINLDKSAAVYAIGFMCFLILGFLVISFHTIFVEWDAVYCYIPSAKAIGLSGCIINHPYRMLDFFDVSPTMPIAYAWMLENFDMGSLYMLPLGLFALTAIAIFLISNKIFPRNFAWVSLLIFVSLPTTLLTMGSRSLYLDIAFLLYTLTTLYVAMNLFDREIQSKSFKFECTVLAMSLMLMLVTKSEFGLLLVPVGIVTLLPILKWKHWGIFSLLLISSPYCLNEIRNILTDSTLWIYSAQRLAPVIIVLALVILIPKFSLKEATESKKPNRQLALNPFVLVLPALGYLLRNTLVLGFIPPSFSLWNKGITTSLTFFNKIRPFPTRGFSELMQWYNLFSVWWFITPYIIPFSIAVISIACTIIKKKKIDLKNVPLLLFFSGIFILWSQLGCDPQPRRLYYLAPFAALTITYGFYTIRKFYNLQTFALRILTYIMTTTLIIWIKNNIKTVNDLALLYGSLYQPNTDIELLAISIGLFLAIFAPYEPLIARIKQKITFSKKATTAIFSSFLLLNVGIFSILATPMIIDVVNNGFQLRYKRYSGWYYYPDVVDYYNENIPDHYTTIGFYCNELITFANRTIIDLYIPIYGSPIYSIIEEANNTEILEVFRKLNVGYFLKPKTNNPFYPTYEKLVNSTVLGSIFLDNPQFRALKTFKYATLYKFYENYTIHTLTYSEIEPWNYNPETNYTLTLDQNLTKFSATTNSAGRISIMYIPEPPLNLGDALWITIKSYSDAELVAILFSNLQNRTTDFLSFQCQLNNETRKPVININEGTIKGNFDPNHVEGLLIGIRTEPNHKETFEISGLYLIAYENT